MALVVNALTAVYDIFWDEKFWLPDGVQWKDLEEQSETMYHPSVRDLRYVIYCATVLFIFRKLYERFVATAIGKYFGIRDTKPRRPPPNPTLEKSYRGKKFPDNDTIQGLAKQTDLSSRKVERWFRMRRNQDRPSVMKRFTEASWRFTFYFSVFIYGVVVLWNKPWFSDSTKCWIGYPHHHISKEIFWYYMVEIGFYSSLMFSQFIDVKRKDFWEMFFHHIATLLLLCFSWCGNFVRVGTLVLVIHDAVDYWMEAAKMAKYIKAQRLCDFLFAIFGIVWFVTRLVIYPIRIIISTLFYAHPIVGFGPVYYTYNVLLISLQVLHVVWTFFIIQVVRAVYQQRSGIFFNCTTGIHEVLPIPSSRSGTRSHNGSQSSSLLSRNHQRSPYGSRAGVIWSTSYELHSLVGMFPSMFFFNGMLCILLILHWYWFSLIARVAYTVLTTSGEEVTDIRSSEEEAVSEEENGTTNHIKHKNNVSS